MCRRLAMVEPVALAARGSDRGRASATQWPAERPRQWLRRVNRPQPKAELEAVQTSVERGRPFGSAIWQAIGARIHLSFP